MSTRTEAIVICNCYKVTMSSTSKTYLRVARSSPAESERCPGLSSGASHGSRDRSRTLPRLLLYTRQDATRLARRTMDISPQCRKAGQKKVLCADFHCKDLPVLLLPATYLYELVWWTLSLTVREGCKEKKWEGRKCPHDTSLGR